jgi:hypothetical protein
MGWETGDASGGSGGFGGTPAAVGFGDGLSNGEILQGSTVAGISGIVNDHEIWFDVNEGGIPVPVGTPEPGTLGIVLAGLGGLLLVRRRKA